MTYSQEYLIKLLNELRSSPNETEWIEFIKEALEEKVIKLVDPDSESRKHAKYIPFWA